MNDVLHRVAAAMLGFHIMLLSISVTVEDAVDPVS